MKDKLLKLAMAAVAILFAALIVPAQQPVSEEKEMLAPITTKTDLYPANADAKKEIDEALKQAATNKKRVLLMFGGNWCYDCHVLDHALHEGEAGKILDENYILVHVDIGEGEKNPDLVKQYKIPLDKGVPALVVLASDGRLLYWSGYGEFEAARKMLKKDVVAFLNYWKARQTRSP